MTATATGPVTAAAPGDGISVLIVDDEHTLRESCASVLMHEGYEVVTCNRGQEALAMLARRNYDMVLLDLHMSGVDGMELLRGCLSRSPDTLVVMMTGNPSVESSLEAMRQGAWDYLPKPFTALHLQVLLGRAAHTVRVARQSAAQRNTGPAHERAEAGSLIGRSPAFLAALELARKVAATDASVFITGESGTGKELFAQFIHQRSRRSSRKMVAVNCAALPETLLESEMFGHVKGAFTGAIRDKLGLLETANGGTFFMDELTEMPLPIQAKLLRAIQDGVVRRVGSETVDAVVNVRFLAATNRDPRAAAAQGILRKDLFYRLSVFPIELPALRERIDDIPLLAEHFLDQYWKRHRGRSLPAPRLGEAAIRELQSRRWTGNVRELQNVMEHAVVLLDPGTEIRAGDLPEGESITAGGTKTAAPSGGHTQRFSEDGYHAERDRCMSDFELAYLSWLVERSGANMSRAAKLAGIDRTTLYRLMDKHRLHREVAIAPQVPF